MADEHLAEILKELRRIRMALCLLVVVLALIAMNLALQFWTESVRPPNTTSLELQGIQNELRALHDELSMQRNPPPVVQSGAQPAAGQGKEGK